VVFSSHSQNPNQKLTAGCWSSAVFNAFLYGWHVPFTFWASASLLQLVSDGYTPIRTSEHSPVRAHTLMTRANSVFML
ncbi:hypothetical protein ACV2ZF_31020, partial [Escherichia coli]